MAKEGIHSKNIGNLIKTINGQRGWALCVGAGISLPAFPDWRSLAKYLLSIDVEPSDLAKVEETLTQHFSPDAVIEAAKDRLNLDDEEFAVKLSELLYSQLKNTLTKAEYECVIFTMSQYQHGANVIQRKSIYQFLNIIRTKFPNMSCLGIASQLIKILDSPIAPNAILSFNAEPLFLLLLSTLKYESFEKKLGRSFKKGELIQKIDPILSSISTRRQDRIPYYFCHGLLPVPSADNKKMGSVDKLVFSESNYLNLANNNFSWQSSVFINTAINYPIIFIGLSLTDPNMRRWLTWTHENKRKEILRYTEKANSSTTHYWITKRYSSEAEQRWVESCVSHLGIRIIWINDWTDVSTIFSKLKDS